MIFSDISNSLKLKKELRALNLLIHSNVYGFNTSTLQDEPLSFLKDCLYDQNDSQHHHNVLSLVR